MKECRDCFHEYHCPMPQEGYDYDPDTCPYNPDNQGPKLSKDKHLEELRKEMDSYNKKIFQFDYDFKPTNNGNVKPDKDGFYITIRCGLSGIYQMLNEWKNGRWMCGVLDGSTTIAFSRETIELESLKYYNGE